MENKGLVVAFFGNIVIIAGRLCAFYFAALAQLVEQLTCNE